MGIVYLTMLFKCSLFDIFATWTVDSISSIVRKYNFFWKCPDPISEKAQFTKIWTSDSLILQQLYCAIRIKCIRMDWYCLIWTMCRTILRVTNPYVNIPNHIAIWTICWDITQYCILWKDILKYGIMFHSMNRMLTYETTLHICRHMVHIAEYDLYHVSIISDRFLRCKNYPI